MTADTGNFNLLDNDLVNFDDFGQDLCPAFGASLTISDLEAEQEAETTNQSVNDCMATFPRSNMQSLPLSKADLPVELKCSLCNKIFRDAVMIPCCQHSFCDKCIRSELVVRSSCPQCGSTKCHVGDLLPNVSLRQAIEHLPEAQMAFSSSAKVTPKYDVPDDESGIQADNVKGRISVRQRQPALLDSPSATGKGSNLVMNDSACEGVAKPQLGSRIIILDSAKSIRSDQKRMKQQQEDGNVVQTKSIDVAGSRDPMLLPRIHAQKDEASLGLKKNKGLFSNDIADVAGRLPLASKIKKGERNCYMCGSPDHLVRDCPAAAAAAAASSLNPYPLHQTGNTVFGGGMAAYEQSYWNGNSFFPVRQFPYGYSASRMMPISPAIIPAAPFAVPPYMPSPYSGVPACGFMNMGGAFLPHTHGTQYFPGQVEIREHPDSGPKQRVSRDQQDRARSTDDEHYDYDRPVDHYKSSPRRTHDHKDRYGHSTSYSSDDNPKTHKRHRVSPQSSSGREFYPSDEDTGSGRTADQKRSCSTSFPRDNSRQYSRKSSTEMQPLLDSSGRHGSKKKRHYHKLSSSRKRSGRTQLDSDSSMDGQRRYHEDIAEHSSDRERNHPHHKKSKHSHHSRMEPTSFNTTSHERQYDEFERTRNTDENGLSGDRQVADDRWGMAGDLDDSYVEEYLRLKRKRRR